MAISTHALDISLYTASTKKPPLPGPTAQCVFPPHGNLILLTLLYCIYNCHFACLSAPLGYVLFEGGHYVLLL